MNELDKYLNSYEEQESVISKKLSKSIYQDNKMKKENEVISLENELTYFLTNLRRIQNYRSNQLKQINKLIELELDIDIDNDPNIRSEYENRYDQLNWDIDDFILDENMQSTQNNINDNNLNTSSYIEDVPNEYISLNNSKVMKKSQLKSLKSQIVSYLAQNESEKKNLNFDKLNQLLGINEDLT